MAAASIGVVGLGVMGSSLSLNLAEKTREVVAGFDLSAEKGAATEARAATEGLAELFASYSELGRFVGALAVPRRIVLLVPAGPPVDACLRDLGELLEPGDVVVDGGNEWYENTERRERELAAKGIHYMGCGISGGAEGARHGPALMVGGPRDAWDLVSGPLVSIAAKAPTDGKPCVSYCGKGGAGNYVKMVHNGIEYGDMQLIGEAYALLRASGRSNENISALFRRWNAVDHPLRSFLIEITAKILVVEDDDDGSPLVDRVLDRTGSKGTGKWTVKDAADLGVPAPTVSAALEARYVSSLKDLRLKASEILGTPKTAPSFTDIQLEDALVCSKICSYAQGLALLEAAATKHGWDLRLADVLEGWRGGCIIRANLLVDFHAAVANDPDFDNLLLAPEIAAILEARHLGWRALVSAAITNGVPVPAMANSLAYYDALRSPRLLSAALTQAQRDCFGGHTYNRTDEAPTLAFTSDWLALAAKKQLPDDDDDDDHGGGASA
ncbi:hypothetical protein CTAYLR_005273 [Chrysophaeum taylorii]|uniref:6-phosphogluconate dehydrogenase, decarboxylating n=1 Tax=Chrysophaeum taylorii TaxID=2483200 RepID=A0AAD7XPK4_9STRA|nr:hypothetical protein CTAYLR_005273 [Chrysophaeum taylorii]